MQRSIFVVPLLASLAVATACGRTDPAQSIASPRNPAATASTEQFDVTSKASGIVYRIMVARPLAVTLGSEAPKGPFPVVYVLDGNLTFGTTVESATAQAYLGEIQTAVIVGISHPADDDLAHWVSLRARDLTPPTPKDRAVIPPELARMFHDGIGGGEAFFRFIVEELEPLIAARYRVDPKNRTLFGHSFGGLFVLDTMFKHPDAFRTYVAASPSIWWGRREVLDGESGFANAVAAGRAAPRLLLTVGDSESHDYVDDVKNLADRLGKLHGNPAYRVQVHVFDGETHVSVVPATISRALRFALSE